jgi:hypothetical protein
MPFSIPKRRRLQARPKPISPLMAAVEIQYLPPAACFVPATADIYTGNGSYPIPGFPGGWRLHGVPCLITGSWQAGHRQSVRASDAHTHIMLVDPATEIRDPYTGNGQSLGSAPDAVLVTGETLSNVVTAWRFVVFSFVADIPGVGRRKVVFLDQRYSYPATHLLVDTFTDINGTDLASHVMDVGSGWTILAGALSINTARQAQIKPGTLASARATAQSGVSSFTGASLEIAAVQTEPAAAGLVLRSTDVDNQYEVRLTTTTLAIVRRKTGAETVLSSTTVSLIPGSSHTLSVAAVNQTISATLDGVPLLQTSSTFNLTASKHGIVLQYDPASGLNAGPVNTFTIR